MPFSLMLWRGGLVDELGNSLHCIRKDVKKHVRVVHGILESQICTVAIGMDWYNYLVAAHLGR
jgi:hypothetical protein